MSEMITLNAQYLKNIDFSPFGQKLGHEEINREIEPAPGVLVIPGVGEVEVDNGEPELNFIRVIRRPFVCEYMERHLQTSQSFIPLEGCCGLMVLAPATEEDRPNPEKTIAVIFDGSEGINIKKGTWHSAPFAISAETKYIMAGRKGTLKNDLHIFDLPTKISIKL